MIIKIVIFENLEWILNIFLCMNCCSSSTLSSAWKWLVLIGRKPNNSGNCKLSCTFVTIVNTWFVSTRLFEKKIAGSTLSVNSCLMGIWKTFLPPIRNKASLWSQKPSGRLCIKYYSGSDTFTPKDSCIGIWNQKIFSCPVDGVKWLISRWLGR